MDLLRKESTKRETTLLDSPRMPIKTVVLAKRYIVHRLDRFDRLSQLGLLCGRPAQLVWLVGCDYGQQVAPRGK